MLMREKICPKCNTLINNESMYCPYDGSLFKYKDIENYCNKCNKQYGTEYKYCPVHGDSLTKVTPANNEEMDEKSIDLFERSVCPKCDAWNNWDIKGNEFTCKSCNEKYNHTNGKLINLGGGSLNIVTNNTKTSSPYYKILSVIDISNRDHWINVFEKIENGKNYKKWNWPSFFFDVSRYFWKGIWAMGLLYFAVFFSVCTAIYIFIPNKENFPLFVGICSFVGKIYMGFSGSKDYYTFIKELNSDEVRAKKELKIGRVLFWVLQAFYVLSNIPFNK